MTSKFLVTLVYTLDDEIKDYLVGCKITISSIVSEDVIVIEVEDNVLKSLQLKRIIYFKELSEMKKS